MFKNVASQKIALFAFDPATNLPKTGDGAYITPYVSKDYGTPTVLGTTTATEMGATNAPGWYSFTLAQAETNADMLLFTAKSSTAGINLVGVQLATFPATGILAPATAGRTLVVDAAGLADANMVKAGPTGSGTAQTARDLGASVLLSAGTGTGQLDFASGVVKANLVQILATALTETAGQIAAAFKKFFNIATPASTMDHLVLLDTVTTATTATNLTNAATAGDLTATMKTSVTTAATAATPTAAAVTGAVGSVTGAVGSVATNGITAASIATDAINAAAVKADAVTKIQAGLATPTNITAGTITTVTNLTNAATAGDLTATMKTSVTAAATAATPTAAAVTGAVGSVTGNVGGNVTGSVGSVTGAVGSVTGNVGGNVVGSVASVATAVATTSNTKKNQALAKFEFLMTDSTTHAPKTGATCTCTRSIDGGAFAAGTLANTAEIAAGVYSVDFGAGDLNGNVVTLRATASGADDTFVTLITQP